MLCGAQGLSKPGVNALRGLLGKGLLSVPGPWGKDVAGISWESLRTVAEQTEVGRERSPEEEALRRKPRTQGQGVAWCQSGSSGLRGQSQGQVKSGGSGDSAH